MKKFLLEYYMAVAAAVGIAAIVLVMAFTAAAHANRSVLQMFVWPAPAEVPVPTAMAVPGCVPRAGSIGVRVGGLDGIAIPRLPGAVRLNYDDNGLSEYSVKASGEQVFNYYFQELADRCWELSALNPGAAEWTRGDQTVKIAVAENLVTRKSLVAYQAAGRVLGVANVQAAQACTEGQVWCSDTSGSGGGWCQMPPCPSSGGYTPPPGGSGSTSCSGGQIWCPDTSGTGGWCQMSPCPSSGYTPPPGGTAPTSCSGGQVWCTNSSGGGGWCQWPPCPTAAPSGGSSCPPPPSGCSSGYNYDSAGCAISCYQSGGTSPESCTGGQVWCTSSGGNGWCQWPPCPSSTDGGYTSSCGSGQYWCNGVCVPMTQSCVSGGGTTPGSCTGGQVWCTGSYGGGGWCQMSPCPSTSGTTCGSGQYWCPGTMSCKPTSDTYCPSSGSSCGTGNYWCNGACIPNGSPCSGGGMGSQPPASGCPSGQYWCPSSNSCIPSGGPCGQSSPTVCPSGQYPCNNVCVPNGSTCSSYPTGGTATQPQGTYPQQPTSGTSGSLQLDPACGANGYRDLNGGCLQLGTGKTPIIGKDKEILICGDVMCDENKGENGYNCPKDCGTPRQPISGTPPGSPNQGQYPGQAPGGFQGQPGQFPGGPGGPGGFGQGQGMGPGGPGGGPQFQMGPSEEEMKMMLEQMKKNMKPMKQGMKTAKKGLATAEKELSRCGMTLPDGMKEAILAMEQIIPKIEAAQSADEIFDLMSTAQEAGDAMQAGQEIPQRIEFCMQLKRVKTVMKGLSMKATSVVKKAQRSKNEDIIALGNTVTETVATAQGLADRLPELAKVDFEGAQGALEEFFMAVEDGYNAIGMVEAALSAKRTMSTLNREVTSINRQLTSLAKKGKDVTVAQALVAQMKEEIAVVLKDLKDKAPADQVLDDIEVVYATRNDLRDAMSGLTGLREQETRVNVNQKPYQWMVPEAFRSQPPPIEGGQPGGPSGLPSGSGPSVSPASPPFGPGL